MYSGRAVTSEVLSDQLGDAFHRFREDQIARHVEMLQAVQKPEDVVLEIEKGEDDLWTITVCTWDCFGALSIISGLFAAYLLDILSVDVFTIHLPHVRPKVKAGRAYWRMRRLRRIQPTGPVLPDRKILDVFQVRSLGAAEPELWEHFKEELGGLIGMLVEGRMSEARDLIVDRVSEAFRVVGDMDKQLFPVVIDLSNDHSPEYSHLSIRSPDTLGFLFAFSNALAMLNVNIERAEIRTRADEVYDTFWLTDANGHKIESARRVHEIRVAAALIKQFTYLLPRSPNPALALRQFNALTHQMLSNPDWTEELQNLESASVLETLAEMMGVSQFLWEDFLRMQHENLFPVLVDAPALERHPSKAYLEETLEQSLSDCTALEDLVKELNRFKDREMFRIDLRHITGGIQFREFSEELTQLAEVVLAKATSLTRDQLRRRYGAPRLASGEQCPRVVCALGKFGGRELGFGSDIEMIFVYQEEGTTDGENPVESSRYFNESVRSLLGVLKAQREGIFEVDLRLRPYGDHGALASSFDAFSQYYSPAGFARQFERMALVKLRPFAGDLEFGNAVARARDDFVYSGLPLDVDNIRHLRHRQATELVPRGEVSTKYSPGGLVDIEYFVQACQIVAGHRDTTVRVTNTLEAIDRLATRGHIREGLATDLREVYGFLRRLIDALRVVRGHARDLTVPSQGSREFAYLAQRLDYPSSEDLSEAIARKMNWAGTIWEYGLPAA